MKTKKKDGINMSECFTYRDDVKQRTCFEWAAARKMNRLLEILETLSKMFVKE